MSHSNGNQAVVIPGPPPSVDDLINRMSADVVDLEVNKFFRALVKLEGSDLHLKVGKPPCVRVRNELKPLNHPPVERREMAEYLVPMMNERNRRIFDDEGGADFSHTCEVDGVRWRFRVNLLQQNGCMGLVARRIGNKIPDFKGLYLPPSIEQLCHYDQGMVLLAGVTGSGKSTTIASMLDYINKRERVHILTLEDPIEFIFTEDKALINQREIGFDVKDFKIGMKHAVREDPDIMLVGEMRDEETFMTAIHAAETGHLVFGTIHASSAPSTIGRILDLFPIAMHNAIRQTLTFNLKAIVAQKLIKTTPEWQNKGVFRVPINEVLLFNPAVRKAVSEGNDARLVDLIKVSEAEGMQDFTKALKDRVEQDMITRESAFEIAPNPDALKMALKGIKLPVSGLA